MAKTKVPKEVKRLLRAAEDQGWGVKPIRDGYQLFAPDGVNIVTVHLTESDKRAMKNTIQRMRAHGFQWEGR